MKDKLCLQPMLGENELAKLSVNNNEFSRDGILCSAADSLHIEVENPREPFYACDAPDNGKFHFVINFSIQSDDD